MPKLEIVYTEEQMKAIAHHVEDPVAWIQHAWEEKARVCIDRIVTSHSDKQPKKIPIEDKLEIIRSAELETAVERNAKLMTH